MPELATPPLKANSVRELTFGEAIKEAVHGIEGHMINF